MMKANSTEIIDADELQRENLNAQIKQGKHQIVKEDTIIIA